MPYLPELRRDFEGSSKGDQERRLIMLTFESGTEFLGFTTKRRCTNCQNDTPFVVRAEYMKQSFAGISYSNGINHIIIQCPVCEKHSNRIAVRGILNISKEKNRKNITDILDAGKVFTKYAVSKMDDQQKNRLYKRLNQIGAHSIVTYLSRP
jgi:hypothetical protein